MIDKHQPFLDAARFFSALMVVIGHCRGSVLANLDQVDHATILQKLLYSVTALHHEGVVIFFVVSGFLVGGAAWRGIRDGVFSFRIYFINRFSRIYLVYLPSLVLCAVLNVVGLSLLTDTWFFGPHSPYPADMTAGQIVCHLFAVQGVLCEPWAADQPLWSLGYEWILYMVAPPVFFVIAARSGLQRLMTGIAVLGFFIALHLANPDIWHWFSLWFIGTIAAVIYERYDIDRRIGFAALAACVAVLMLVRAKVFPVGITNFALALSFATAISCRAIASTKFNAGWITRGAQFSYSLYLTHGPVTIFSYALLEHLGIFAHQPEQPGVVAVIKLCALVAIALLAADLFARITEDRTPEARRYLRGLFPGKTMGQQAAGR